MVDDRRDQVEVLGADLVPEIVNVLCDSFFDYPVMRFVLGPDGDYPTRIRRLIEFFVQARALRNEPLLGVRREDRLAGVALVSFPDGGASPPELSAIRDRVWQELGTTARTRYETFGAAAAALVPVEEHIHLNMIGVLGSAQGHGLGRLLLEAVHARAASDPSCEGVSLTTELESNVPIYEHFGYEVIGSARVESVFTTWTMFRRMR